MTRTYLDRKTEFLLAKLIQDEYTTLGSSDVEFAEYAAGVLNAPVKKSHISALRDAFDIPASNGRVRAKTKEKLAEALETRFRAVEIRLKALEDRIEVYCTGSRK